MSRRTVQYRRRLEGLDEQEAYEAIMRQHRGKMREEKAHRLAKRMTRSKVKR